MAITPQSIKDAEFQLKMRGYDQVEVRAYLERVAEDYLKLIEELGRQAKGVKVLTLENKQLRQNGKSGEQEISAVQVAFNNLKKECQQERQVVDKQKDALAALGQMVDQLEGEKRAVSQKLGRAETKIQKLMTEMSQERMRSKKNFHRFQQLEKKQKNTAKEELELKKTLAAAQKFSEEMIQKSEQQASEVLGQARLEIEKIRREAREELAYFPAEIKRMKAEHRRVKEQLQAVVKSYLKGFEGTAIKDSELDGQEEIRQEERSGNDSARFTARSEEKTVVSSTDPPGAENQEGNGELTRESYETIHALEDQDELFQSISLPEDVPLDNDYLDELGDELSLTIDLDE